MENAIKELAKMQYEHRDYRSAIFKRDGIPLMYVGSVNLAIQALEKQIAKKPTNKGKTFTKHWLCPTCNRLYWERGHLDGYCMSCGQKFDLD